MPKTFRCCECGKRRPRNPRLKGNQKYCSAAVCQQSRKNAWERSRYRRDAEYRCKRQASKQRWRETDRQGSAYQANYRKTHPLYREENRRKQLLRNQKRPKGACSSKIVKTDALAPQSVEPQGIYILIPYGKETGVQKIVKTDALLVQLVDNQEYPGRIIPPNPP